MLFNRVNKLALAIVASAIFIYPTLAGAAGTFSLTPGKEEVSLAPGAATIKNLTVVNNLGREASFTLNLESVAGSEVPGETVKFLTQTASPYSLQRFLTLPVKTFTLRDGESRVVPVAIDVPATTPPGGYFGALTVAVTPESKSVTKVTARLSSLWFVKVDGPVAAAGHLLNFGPIGGVWQFWPKQLNFQFSFQNEGNTYLNPYGGIELKPRLAWGFTRSIIVPPNFVLPGSTRLFEIKAPAGTFCGWYKTTLKLNRGYNNVIDEQGGNLITCGRSFSFILLVIILILTGLTWWLVIKLKRRHLNKVWVKN